MWWNDLSRRASCTALVTGAVLSFAVVARAAHPVVQAFDTYPSDQLLSVENGTLETVPGTTGTTYRWHINTGETSWLGVRPEHAVFDTLRYYDHLYFDYRIASGTVSAFGLRAQGHVSGPRRYKPHMWTCAIRTTPPVVWRHARLDLARPDRLLHNNADGEPEDGFFGLRAMAIDPDTVIELRDVRLLRGALLLKPDFELPITWPVKTGNDDGSVTYRMPLRVLNTSGKPTTVRAEVVSQHERFAVVIEPGEQDVKFSRIASFELAATMSAGDIAGTRDLYEERLRVRFIPAHVPEASVEWLGHLVRPLSKTVRRQAALSAAELAEIREGVASDAGGYRGWFNYDKTVAAADAFVGKRLDDIPHSRRHVRNGYPGAPDRRGRMKPGAFMSEAVVPGTDYREVGTDRAGQVWYNYLGFSGRACRKLGMAYLMTGDEKYALKGIELLERYGEQFTEKAWTYWRDVPWNLGTTVGASSRIADFATYGSNWYMKGLSLLAAMIAESPSWTPEARERVYRGFVLPYVTELTKIVGTIGNQQDISNRNLLLLGLAFDDATSCYYGLMTDAGAVSRVSDIEPDGFSSEGRPLNYHFAAMAEYLPTLAYLANSKLVIDYPKERLLAAARMPYQRATLGGIVPGAGDSGRGHGMEYYRNNGLVDWLVGLFPEEAWIRTIGGSGTPAKKLWLMKTGGKTDPDAWRHLLETDPRLFAASGMAILRSGDTEQDQVMVTFDYGRNVYHAARDRGHFSITAFGKRITQGTGSGYNVGSGGIVRPKDPRLRSFTNAGSLGQNVIMVDAKDQTPCIGRLLAWSAAAGRQVAVARMAGVQPGVTHTRGVVLSHGVIVLLDRVESGDEHAYDFVYHNFGKFSPGPGWAIRPLAELLGRTANYENIVDPAVLSGEGPVRLSWDLTDQIRDWQRARLAPDSTLPVVALDLWQLPVEGGVPHLGTTGANNKDNGGMPDPMRSLITRVRARSADFLTVLEPHKGTPRVKTVAARPGGGIVVTLQDGSAIEASLDDLVAQHAVAAAG